MSRIATIDRMIETIGENDKPALTKQDIADELDVSWQTISNHAEELKASPDVQHGQIGKAEVFWLVDDGPLELNEETMDELPKEECQKPDCTDEAEQTYTDGYGNRLRLCEEHYYELVAGQGVVSVTHSSRKEPEPLFGRLFGRGDGSGEST